MDGLGAWYWRRDGSCKFLLQLWEDVQEGLTSLQEGADQCRDEIGGRIRAMKQARFVEG